MSDKGRIEIDFSDATVALARIDRQVDIGGIGEEPVINKRRDSLIYHTLYQISSQLQTLSTQPSPGPRYL